MRFLHSADWHLGRVHHGVSLLEDQAHLLRQFVRLAAELRPDAILLAGDIYDRSVPPAEAVRLLDLVLTELVQGLRIPVVMIAGNHDGPDRLAFGASLLGGAGLSVRGVVDAQAQAIVLHDAHGAVAIHALPYAEPAVVRAALGGTLRSEDDSTAPVIDSHQAALAAQLRAARAAQQAGTKGQSIGAVVVASDHHHRDAQALHQLGQHQIEQAHSLGRRHRAVVDVACQQDGVRSQLGGKADELTQQMGLVFEQGDAVMNAAEMPVGRMKKTHADLPEKGVKQIGC